MINLQGKRAVVTGGRRGIGKALALALKQAGASVTVIAKSPDSGSLPSDISYIQADLSLPRDRRLILSSCGSIDILINNAGIVHSHSALSYPEDDWSVMLEINLTAVFDLSCQAVRLGCKRIIQLASVSSFNGARNIVGYTTAKHGLIGMTKCLSNEWAHMGITVNNIAPGLIETDMISSLTNDKSHSGEVLGRIPIGRFGQPQDIVGAMMFLASDDSKYVTGSTIVVDGGWMAR